MISVPFPLSYEVWCSGDLKFEMTVYDDDYRGISEIASLLSL